MIIGLSLLTTGVVFLVADLRKPKATMLGKAGMINIILGGLTVLGSLAVSWLDNWASR